MITLNVNGKSHTLDIDPNTPLLYALRDELELNAAKYGCGLGQCGACTVMVDGNATFSCLLPVSALHDSKVKTVEGLGGIDNPSPVQRAFIEEQAAQCGYCSAGMIMRAQSLLEGDRHPSRQDIRDYMQTNLCRCGTHMRILAAVERAAAYLRGEKLPEVVR